MDIKHSSLPLKKILTVFVVTITAFSFSATATSQEQPLTVDTIDWASYLGYWYSGTTNDDADTADSNHPVTKPDAASSNDNSVNLDSSQNNPSPGSEKPETINHSNSDSNWRVVTVGNADGFVLYPKDRQWISRECLTTLRNEGAPIETVQWGHLISSRPQTTNRLTCDELVFAFTDASCTVSSSTAGSNWRVMTVSNNGDGYLLFPDGMRKWLNSQCIADLRSANLAVESGNWDEVKDLLDASSNYSCETVLSTLANAGSC